MTEIKAAPAKSFFVKMLTRDIELKDCIFDLMDNCVDGAVRTTKKNGNNIYEGFLIDISFDSDHFKISDNCGGIPREIAAKYAFMLGRPDEDKDLDIPTLGIYGIGMKRAMFKMGKQIEVFSYPLDGPFRVKIDEKWLMDNNNWNLEMEELDEIPNRCGTEIIIKDIYNTIADDLASPDFKENIIEEISRHYSYIILKGLQIKVNGIEVDHKPFAIKWADKIGDIEFRPYIFKWKKDEIDIKIALGFIRDIPNDDEIENSLEGRIERGETAKAGWTVICNDRVVLYCDKSHITGWGIDNNPNYHTQFIQIGGVVMMDSNRPDRLPLTTTKRGLDLSSDTYAIIKEEMKKALKTFTSYTNKWKGRLDEERKWSVKADAYDVKQIFNMANKSISNWTNSRKYPGAQYYEPKLPTPERTDPVDRITFLKKRCDIRTIAEIACGDEKTKPSLVGEWCFDYILQHIDEFKEHQ